MAGPENIVTAKSEKAYRLGIIAKNGHVPHDFVRSIERCWGLEICVVCRKTNLYFAHDGDLRGTRDAAALDG